MRKRLISIEKYQKSKCLQIILFGLFAILLIIYFISIPKILMIGFPSEMVYQYNGPFVFDNLDVIGNKNINNLIDFSNYDLVIFRISPQMMIKYGYHEKISNFTGKIIVISNSEIDRSQIIAMAPKSKVFRYDHLPSLTELKAIL